MNETKVKYIIDILRHNPLTPTMLCIFKALWETGEVYLSGPKIFHAIWPNQEYNFSKLGLGGLGLRINNIDPSFNGIGYLIDITSQDDLWVYRMLPELREAIEKTRIIREVISNYTYKDIRRIYKDRLKIIPLE